MKDSLKYQLKLRRIKINIGLTTNNQDIFLTIKWERFHKNEHIIEDN